MIYLLLLITFQIPSLYCLTQVTPHLRYNATPPSTPRPSPPNIPCAQRGHCNTLDLTREGSEDPLPFYARNCFCDDSCVLYGDCCSDFSGRGTGSRKYLTKFRELGSQLTCQRIEMLDTLVEIYIVTSCPSGYRDQFIRNKCEYKSDDDQFLNLPVTNSRFGILYRNIYCAICSAYKDNYMDFIDDILYWIPVYKCDSSATSLLVNDATNHVTFDILRSVTSLCRLELRPPGKKHAPRKCKSNVRACPRRRRGDPKLARLCFRGPTSYVYHDLQIFKNKYCAQCYRLNKSDLQCEDQRTPWIEYELLKTKKEQENLNNDDDTLNSLTTVYIDVTNGRVELSRSGNRRQIQINNNCKGTGMTFDPFAGECLLVGCETGWEFTSGNCLQIRTNLSSLSTEPTLVTESLIASDNVTPIIDILDASDDKIDNLLKFKLENRFGSEEFPESYHLEFGLIQDSTSVESSVAGRSNNSSSQSANSRNPSISDLESSKLTVSDGFVLTDPADGNPFENDSSRIIPQNAEKNNEVLMKETENNVENLSNSSRSKSLYYRTIADDLNNLNYDSYSEPSETDYNNLHTDEIESNEILSMKDYSFKNNWENETKIVDISSFENETNSISTSDSLEDARYNANSAEGTGFDRKHIIINSNLSYLDELDSYFQMPFFQYRPLEGLLIFLVGIISLCSLIGAFLALVLLPRRSRDIDGRSMLCLIVSLIMSNLLYMLSIASSSPRGSRIINDIGCFTVAVLLHFFYLVSFLWINVLIIDLCRSVLSGTTVAITTTIGTTKMSKSSRQRCTGSWRFLAYSLYSWFTPAIIVCCGILLDIYDVNVSIKPRYGNSGVCWISGLHGQLLLVATPLGILAIIDGGLIVITSIQLCRPVTSLDDVVAKQYRYWLLLCACFRSMSCATWICAYAFIILKYVGIAPYLIFVSLNASQSVLAAAMAVTLCSLRRYQTVEISEDYDEMWKIDKVYKKNRKDKNANSKPTVDARSISLRTEVYWKETCI